MIKQKKIIIGSFILVIVVVGLSQIFQKSNWISEKIGFDKEREYSYQDNTLSTTVTPLPKPITIEIDFGSNKKYNGEIEGKNALDVLKNFAQKENITVETQKYKFGSMVISIGDKKNSNNEYWVYYVNDQAGQVASDYFGVYPGDRVTWRYTKSSK